MSLSIVVLNQSWFVDELRNRGHKVVTLGWNDTSADILIPMPGLPIDEVLADQLDFKPDVLLYHRNSLAVGRRADWLLDVTHQVSRQSVARLDLGYPDLSTTVGDWPQSSDLVSTDAAASS